MVATDGVYFLTPHPSLDIDSDALGKWDADNHENLSVLMPGLYWDDDSRASIRENRDLQLRSRGVSGKYLAPFIDQFDAEWNRLREGIPLDNPDAFRWPEDAPALSVTVEFSVVSPRLAAARDNWWQCGLVLWDESRKISADPSGKRSGFFRDPARPDLLRSDPWERIPYPNSDPDLMFDFSTARKGELESHPYRRLFGQDLEDALGAHLLEEFLTPDGTYADVLRALRGRA
jgi:hypothetical protein